MSDHMVFHDCPDWQKEAIRSYWLQKTPRIERLLTRFPEDQRELRLTVTHKPKRYDVHAVLLLPTGSLAAEASSPTDRDAIDMVVDKLVAEVRRHKEAIRRDYLYHRKAAPAGAVRAGGCPVAAGCCQAGQGERSSRC